MGISMTLYGLGEDLGKDLRALLRPDTALASSPPITRLALLTILAAAGHGLVIGSYWDVDAAPRLWQMVYSAIKVPLLIAVSFALALPVYLFFMTWVGLAEDRRAAVVALMRGQASMTVVLVSLSPLVALTYLSFADYDLAKFVNLLVFAVASVVAQIPLRRSFGPLIRARPRHRVMLIVWFGLFAFVGVQMSYVLRPFIGSPGVRTTFFREDAWQNAYVEVARLVMDVLGR